MIPATYPSVLNINNKNEMVIFPVSNITGLERWKDYIPVKFIDQLNTEENSHNNNGYKSVKLLDSSTGKQAWLDYVPVYIDSTASDAWEVKATGFIPVGTSGASLSLQFAGSTNLDPRITFSRASNATLVGSDGNIQYAPHNLLSYSEQFDNSYWNKSNANVSANTSATTAPNGTFTADLILGTGVSASYLYAGYVASAGVPFFISCYVKNYNLTGSKIVWIRDFTEAGLARFNLNSGSVDQVSGIASDASITNVGDNWYRISAKFTPTVSGNHNISPVHIGDSATTTGFYAWGAQLNVGSLQPYYSTTVKNLLGYTQEFDNAAWTKSNSSISATKVTAPDGSVTGQKLVENSASGVTHRIAPAASIPMLAAPMVFSVYLKAGERTTAAVNIYNSTDGERGITVDLSNGTISTVTGTVPFRTITSVGNGWYKVAIGVTATVAANTTTLVYLNTYGNYTGDGTSGLYIWGAQLSDSASLDPYVYNPVAAPSAGAYYGPRFDYDPVTLQPKGLLIEEQRTNLLTYSDQFDNAVWTVSGVTKSADTAISPSGATTADSVLETATTARHGLVGQNGTISLTAGTFAMSCYVKANGRSAVSLTLSRNNTNNYAIATFDLSGVSVTQTGAVGTGFSYGSASITAIGNGWYRCVMICTVPTAIDYFFGIYASNATTFTPDTVGGVNNYAGDITKGLYIWGAQLEAGAFPTSYIPTTTASATRSADVALMQGANFSNWYNQTEGTLYLDAINMTRTSSVQYSRLIAAVGTNADTDEISIYTRTAGAGVGYAYGSITASGTTTFDLSSAATTIDAWKAAVAYKTNDAGFACSGLSIPTDTSVTLPVGAALRICGAVRYQSMPSAWIKRIAYYNRRLSNSELQGITS